MRTPILALNSLAIALAYELPVWFCRLMPAPARRARVAGLALGAMEHFVATARTYAGLRLSYERPAFRLPARCLVVANHQSLLDIPILMHYFKSDGRLRFVSKKELGRGIPLVSSVLRLGGHALVDRGANPARSMRRIAAFARRCLADGAWPVIFPEGTRSVDGSLGAFHSAGLRRIAETAPAPIVVVAIDGGLNATRLGALLAGRADLEYRVKAVALIPPAGDKRSVAAALGEARAAIDGQLAVWHSGTG